MVLQSDPMSEARDLQTLHIRPGGPHQPENFREETLPGPIVDFLRQASSSLLVPTPAAAVPGSPGGGAPSAAGFTDVVAMLDAAVAWQELLVPCIAAARCESARLLVLVRPSETGSSRLDEVRHELQCHDIRTLPAGVRCVEAPELLPELLAESLQNSRRPIIVFRSGSTAAAVAAVELLMRSPNDGAEVREGHAKWQLTVASAPGQLQSPESSTISQKR